MDFFFRLQFYVGDIDGVLHALNANVVHDFPAGVRASFLVGQVHVPIIVAGRFQGLAVDDDEVPGVDVGPVLFDPASGDGGPAGHSSILGLELEQLAGGGVNPEIMFRIVALSDFFPNVASNVASGCIVESREFREAMTPGPI